jgi:5-methylcytosine-specific restriction endonuclease McrA
MTEEHLDQCLHRLDDTRRLLDAIQTDLRGAQAFRDAVFDLLEGTPFGSQADSLKKGITRATVIRDHVIPLAEDGRDDETNEQALCQDCSDTKTQEEAKRGVRRHYGKD